MNSQSARLITNNCAGINAELDAAFTEAYKKTSAQIASAANQAA